jgi:hypothetical protein
MMIQRLCREIVDIEYFSFPAVGYRPLFFPSQLGVERPLHPRNMTFANRWPSSGELGHRKAVQAAIRFATNGYARAALQCHACAQRCESRPAFGRALAAQMESFAANEPVAQSG